MVKPSELLSGRLFLPIVTNLYFRQRNTVAVRDVL